MNTNQLTCKNCGSEQVAEFCCHCGQKTMTERYTTKSFLIKFLSAFNFEKGFFYTMKMLFVNPGELVNNYLSGKTKVYYNPLNYLLLVTGVGAALVIWLGIFDANIQGTNEVLGINKNPKDVALQRNTLEFMKQYINIISLFLLPFISLFSKWFFHKRKLFYGEHLILNSFVLGQSSAISILLLPIYLVIPTLIKYYSLFGGVLVFTYYSYVFRSIFKKSIFKSILGSFVTLGGGYLLFMILIIILTIIVIIIMVISGGSLEGIIAQ